MSRTAPEHDRRVVRILSSLSRNLKDDQPLDLLRDRSRQAGSDTSTHRVAHQGEAVPAEPQRRHADVVAVIRGGIGAAHPVVRVPVAGDVQANETALLVAFEQLRDEVVE